MVGRWNFPLGWPIFRGYVTFRKITISYLTKVAESKDDNFTTLATELKVHHRYLHLMIWSKELILTEPIALILRGQVELHAFGWIEYGCQDGFFFFHRPNLGTTCLARRSGFAWEAHVSQSTNGQPSTSLALLLDSSQGLGFFLLESSILLSIEQDACFFWQFFV